MDINFLLENSAWFASEVRKHFPEGESPVSHYRCLKNVVVISNKKLYVFYVDPVIDYKEDKLDKVTIELSNNDLVVVIKIKNKTFEIEFLSIKDKEMFVNYYEKYR